ncbi:MAG: hypothetical protein H7Y04_08405 [Verrucomicrobia bacterium]|nr:hypothetical protein [Cytophagales bacterium]
MNNLPIQEKIESLICQLEEIVALISTNQKQETKELKEIIELALHELVNQFDQKIKKIDKQHLATIKHFEEEINYLRELNSAQRQMLEDTVSYIKKLEEKSKV